MVLKKNLIIVALQLISALVRVISIFIPVSEKKAVFVSFSGKNYDSNPRYFYEYMRRKNKKMTYIWAFQKIPNYKVSNCIQVRYGSIRYFYYLLSSKYWFFDVGLTRGLKLSTKKHIVVHFLHGVPLKKMGKDMKTVDKLDLYGDCLLADIATYILTQGDYTTKIMSRAYSTSRRKFLPIGSPRTDCLFDIKSYELEDKSLENLKDKTVILYLPTMREWKKNDRSYADFIKKLSLSDDQILVFKSHPSNRFSIQSSNIYDATDIVSINDLYSLADILITDYSSALFDYSILEKPIILYQNDYDDYISNRGLYLSMDQLGLNVCKTEEELCNVLFRILNDDLYYKLMCEKTKLIKKRFIENDNPHSSELLYNKLFGPKKER